MKRDGGATDVYIVVLGKEDFEAFGVVLATFVSEIVRSINAVADALDPNREGLSKVEISGYRLKQFNRLREVNAGGMSVYKGSGVVVAEMPGTVENGGYRTGGQLYSYAHSKRDHFKWS